MKAMILAAGKGTRLRPLTDSKPKALVEINQVPLLEIVIKRLKSYGFNEIIINVHHFAESIIEFLNKKKNFDIKIAISNETDLLLDTGGGLKKTSWFFNDNMPFLVHNVDVLSDINLKQLYEAHIQSEALATLAVRKKKSSRYLLFDNNNKLCGWKNIKENKIKLVKSPDIRTETNLNPSVFCGVSVIDPSLFDLITEQGVFSIIDVYIRLAANNNIVAFNHDGSFWMDVGKKENLKVAGEKLVTSL